MNVTWNGVLQVMQILVTSGAAAAVLKGGIAMRDAIRDLNTFTQQLRTEVSDHEDRLRVIEGKPERRHHERRLR